MKTEIIDIDPRAAVCSQCEKPTCNCPKCAAVKGGRDICNKCAAAKKGKPS